MRGNVLTGDVGDELLEPVSFDVEDQATFLFLLGAAIPFRPKRQAEMMEPIFSIRTRLASSTSSATGDVATVVNREDNRLEEVPVRVIERAVYEDAAYPYAADAIYFRDRSADLRSE